MKVEEVFHDFPRLETERTLLRKITLDDVQEMFEYCSDEDVAKYTTWHAHQKIEDTIGFIHFLLHRYEHKQPASWGIEDKTSGKLIGTCGYVMWNPAHSKAEIGYALSKKYWGKGYMTETAGKVVEFGFTAMRLARIEAVCHPENIGSSRVMEKVGMKYEGCLRSYAFVKGKHQDVRMYSILRTDFESSTR